MKYTRSMAMAGAAMCCIVACGAGADPDGPAASTDSALFMTCAESRGSLLELHGMLGGSKRVDSSTLEHGAGMLTRLADRVAAGNEVRANLARWKQALTQWSGGLSAMQPRIENGRLIEPDTSILDRALLEELRAVDKPLADWVHETCKNVQL